MGGTMFVGLGVCARACMGDGGVYTLRAVGGGDEVELDLFDGCLCKGGACGSGGGGGT
jgi:hypothetical protein